MASFENALQRWSTFTASLCCSSKVRERAAWGFDHAAKHWANERLFHLTSLVLLQLRRSHFLNTNKSNALVLSICSGIKLSTSWHRTQTHSAVHLLLVLIQGSNNLSSLQGCLFFKLKKWRRRRAGECQLFISTAECGAIGLVKCICFLAGLKQWGGSGPGKRMMCDLRLGGNIQWGKRGSNGWRHCS